jgi:hypothetical protein
MASNGSQVLMDNETLSATTVGNSFNLVGRSQEHVAFIKAENVNGATTVAGKVEHSPDGTNWFDLATFGNIVGTSGSEVVNLTVGVLPNVRANVTLSGATQAADVTVSVFYRERS